MKTIFVNDFEFLKGQIVDIICHHGGHNQTGGQTDRLSQRVNP